MHLPPSMEGRGARLAAALLGVGGYVFLPLAALKLLCLVSALGLLLSLAGPRHRWLTVGWLAVSAYAGAFVLNPVACVAALHPGSLAPRTAALLWQAGLVLLGCGWVWLALSGTAAPRADARWPGTAFVLLWAFALVSVQASALPVDVSYGGDEHYHMDTASAFATLIYFLAIRAPSAVLIGLWLLASAAWFLAKNPTAPSRRRWLVGWACAGLVVLGAAAWLAYPIEQLVHPGFAERALRYPATQPWWSALLGVLSYEYWGRGDHLSFGVLRLLPVLGLWWVGLWLASDGRWRSAPLAARLLAVLALTTLPTLLYHGTMLYLELPLVALLLVVLRDARYWLWAPVPRLQGRLTWWAGLGVGLMKETGWVALGCLWLARVLTQGWSFWRRRGRRRPGEGLAAVGRELALGLAMLGPGALYLLLRGQLGFRPYALHLGNVLLPGLWEQAGRALIAQFGWLWVLAIAGLVCLFQARRYGVLVATGTVFLGIGALHFLEDPKWVGLGRFNLLLLPVVWVWAWELLTRLRRRRPRLSLALVIGLLLGNWAGRPIDLLGRRADWGGSGERWYDWSACLAEIRDRQPTASVLVGNTSPPYALNLVADRLGWRPAHSLMIGSPPGVPPAEAVAATLRYAAGQGIDFVIYRSEQELELLGNFAEAGFGLIAQYPARIGALWLFGRIEGPSSSTGTGAP